VNKQSKSTPLGSWGGRIGDLVGEVFFKSTKANKAKISEYMGINQKNFDKLYQKMLEEVNEYKTFCKSHRIYTRKI